MEPDAFNPDQWTVSEPRFTAVIMGRAGPLISLAEQLAQVSSDDDAGLVQLLTRPFLAVVLSQSSQLEELLDAYGAANNARWHGLRSTVAALKAFSQLHYSLLHLQLASPGYRLLDITGNFAADTRKACIYTGRTLCLAAARLVTQARDLSLRSLETTVCAEELPAGRLAQDRASRTVEAARETIARLATAFLNAAEAASGLRPCDGSSRPAPGVTPTVPGEAELRDLQERFHNLQALYDTHLANTDVERADPALRSLRGHASVAYHLLEIGTGLAHHYERHIRNNAHPNGTEICQLVGTPHGLGLLEVLCGYALNYVARFVLRGRALAQDILRRYAEPSQITVPIPRYRGFHVRPSTLLAKIVNHYGSPVTLTLEGETYDAAQPLELFRANERINAHKRRWLATEVARVANPTDADLGEDLQRAARRIVMNLAEQARVVIYEQPLPHIDHQPDPTQPRLNWLIDEISRLQSLGKIDIETQLQAVIRGDRRVLADISLLAHHGYGEDAHGNNIALPSELAYLRAGF